MVKSYVMQAKHLAQLRVIYDNGIPYHFNNEDDVNKIKAIITENAVKLEYGIPESGIAYLRINVLVKDSADGKLITCSGGALTSEKVDIQLEQMKQIAIETYSDKVIKEQKLTVSILNEWERYSLVFDLILTMNNK